ncbi:MAG: hypothetical protein IRY92_12010 [Dactylosporangium sp.]|nr:hypothetical protein [Dactylosporangium sp.]
MSFDRYARLYAAVAATILPMSFVPPFKTSADLYGHIVIYGDVWDMAGRGGGFPAAVAALLLLAMVGCLLGATVRPDVLPLPIINGVCAATIAVLVITRPATNPTPQLSPGGVTHLALAIDPAAREAARKAVAERRAAAKQPAKKVTKKALRRATTRRT